MNLSFTAPIHQNITRPSENQLAQQAATGGGTEEAKRKQQMRSNKDDRKAKKIIGQQLIQKKLDGLLLKTSGAKKT